jgi:hypothetical protein
MKKKRRSKEEKLSILKEAESQGVEVTIMQHGFIHLLSTAGVRRKLSFPPPKKLDTFDKPKVT